MHLLANRSHPIMTRSELINRLAMRFPMLTRQDAAASVATIIDAISNCLASRGRAEIRGFGSFSINVRPPRLGHNPKTGESVPVPEKAVPHFKPGVEMRERVNGAAKASMAMPGLIEQVLVMVEQSGNPEGFDAEDWLARWMQEPLSALGGKRPADYMVTDEGQRQISQLLSTLQSGSYV
jgi:integration host factor subunit beta